MANSSLKLGLVRLIGFFFSLRAFEAISASAALLVTSAVYPALAGGDSVEWLLRRELAGVWLILRVYYLGFHYLLVSMLAFALVATIWDIRQLHIVTFANVAPYLLHSGAVIAFIFQGAFEPFWAAWILVGIVNGLAPILTLRKLALIRT